MSINTINWRKILVILSFGLNIIVIAALIGFALRPDKPRAARTQLENSVFLLRALPQDKRVLLRGKIRNNQDFHQKRATHAKALQTTLIDALRVTPFDKQTIEKLLQDNQATHRDAYTTFMQYWLEVVENMSPDERATYAQQLAAQSKRRAKAKEKRKF